MHALIHKGFFTEKKRIFFSEKSNSTEKEKNPYQQVPVFLTGLVEQTKTFLIVALLVIDTWMHTASHIVCKIAETFDHLKVHTLNFSVFSGLSTFFLSRLLLVKCDCKQNYFYMQEIFVTFTEKKLSWKFVTANKFILKGCVKLDIIDLLQKFFCCKNKFVYSIALCTLLVSWVGVTS